MKRSVLPFFLILLCSWSLAQDKRALDHQAPDDAAFSVLADGRVLVQGEVFDSMAAWQRSDKFRNEGRRCGGRDKMLLRGITPYQSKSPSDCTNNQTVINPEYYISETLTIPVVFHILTDTDGTGDIADSLIISQVEILNEDFGAFSGTPGAPGYDTGVRFELAGITRTANRQWFNDRREQQYKDATGWDRDLYLNIWTNTASGYLGYAYYPDGSAGTVYDGVVLNYVAVGRDAPEGGIYDQGRTATHEVGHYLGLAHTFEGGCGDGYTAGDLIADTNPESTQQFDCIERVTCGSPDPIHNYMDYTPDACMDNFTMEQANRVVCSLVNYRPDLAGGGTEPPTGFALSASPYKVRGVQHVDLSWSGAAGAVDIYRDGALIATTGGSAYTDNLGVKGSGSYTYQVCDAGTATCSNSATAAF